MYFCVKCGKKIKEGVFCSEHDKEKKTINTDLNLKACPSGRYCYNNKWTKYDSPELFLKSVLKKIHKRDFDVNIVGETHKKLILEADGEEFVLKIEKSDAVQLKKSHYFEGVMQFRYPKEFGARLVPVLDKQIALWDKKDVYVTKTSNQKDGLDWWVTSKRAMSLFADQLNRSFGARISKNAQLFSRNKQSSKDIFRLNILVEFPSFQEGAAVLVKNKLAEVIQLRRFIKAVDLKTGKTFGFKLNDEPELLKSFKTRVSSVKPEVMVLHPETYQEELLANQKVASKVKAGEKVKVVIYEKKVYLLP